MNLPINHYVIIGSWALGIRFAKDIDVICYEKDVQCQYTRKDDFSGFFIGENGRKIELLFADKQKSFQTILKNHHVPSNATYEEQYAIKKGHIIVPGKNWNKHMNDLQILALLINGETEELWKLHRKCTQERLKLRTPRLKGVSKEDFFDDYVQKFYEHDDIHKCMAFKEYPMYSYMQKNSDCVECDRELWEGFPYQEKIYCVLEEAYVIALERHYIPTIKGIKVGKGPIEAFLWAVMRICTNLCFRLV